MCSSTFLALLLARFAAFVDLGLRGLQGVGAGVGEGVGEMGSGGVISESRITRIARMASASLAMGGSTLLSEAPIVD